MLIETYSNSIHSGGESLTVCIVGSFSPVLDILVNLPYDGSSRKLRIADINRFLSNGHVLNLPCTGLVSCALINKSHLHLLSYISGKINISGRSDSPTEP